MITLIIAAILLSHSTGNSSSCWEKIPLGMVYSKNTIYTYQHKIAVSNWVKDKEAESKNISNSFRSLIYPYAKEKDGYSVYDIVVNAQNNELLELMGKRAIRLPQKYLQPIYPIGQIDNNEKQNALPIKEIECDKVFNTYEEASTYSGDIEFTKKSVNKIVGTESGRVAKKRVSLIKMETRKEITLKGKMTGTGTETVTSLFIYGTNELYEQKNIFVYEYKIGYGVDRRSEIMKGTYSVKLLGRGKYIQKKKNFPEYTDKQNYVSYFTNNNGIYIPVELSNNFKAKMYLNTASSSSFIDYDYFMKNYEGEPKDYFYPFTSMKIDKNQLDNPGIEIIDPKQTELSLDYKVPGVLGKDILSLGALNINDVTRQLSFWETEQKTDTPSNATAFELVNGTPIFNLMVNGTTVKATIGFEGYEPEISHKLKDRLALKTIKVAVPKGTDLLASFMYKTDIIITPSNREYFKTAAIVQDFGDAPYDIKLGLNYIKGKDFTIDYINNWFVIN